MNKKEVVEQRLEEIFENNKNKKVLEIKNKMKKELISFNFKMKKEDLFTNIKHYKDILSENGFWKDKVGNLYKDIDHSIENLYEDIATLNY